MNKDEGVGPSGKTTLIVLGVGALVLGALTVAGVRLPRLSPPLWERPKPETLRDTRLRDLRVRDLQEGAKEGAKRLQEKVNARGEYGR